MIPKRVTVENFLSFGPKTEILFTDDEPLWVLGGQNGIGKSAVFDAMTYCLFAQHRGGAQDADSLIHHGEDRFGVSFEFEFNGEDYRIVRNKKRRAPATQSIECRIDGQWHRVDGVDGVKPTNEWIVKKLGLNFASFQASVLLRQGEAEKILDAGGTERMTILKSVLGLERFEGLSSRIAEESKSRKAELKALKDKRTAMAEVTTEEMAEAESTEHRAAEAKAAAGVARETAAAGLGHAKAWGESEPKRSALERKLSDAAARSAEAARIRADFAEYGVLAEVLPILRKFVPLRTSLEEAVPVLLALSTARDVAETTRGELAAESESAQSRGLFLKSESVTKGRSAKDGRAEIAIRKRLLTVAQEVASLDSQWKGYAPALERITSEAVAADEVAKEALTRARDMKVNRDNDLRRASELKAKFDSLTIDVPCSACGNSVTAEHKEREIRTATDDHSRLLELAAKCGFDAASRAAKATATERTELESRLRARDSLAERLESKRRDLENFGGTSDSAEITLQVAGLTAVAEADECAQSAADAEWKRLDDRSAQLAGDLRAAITASRTSVQSYETFANSTGADRVLCATFIERLPVDRRAATAADVAESETVFVRFAQGKIVDEYEHLQLDGARREEWQSQMAELSALLDAIPLDARRPLREAEEACDNAKRFAIGAEAAWQIARDASGELHRRSAAFAELCSQLLAAERAAAVHAKLHDLLGNGGLLRELVRVAEVEIVRFANDSLQKLSDGDLSLELSREPKKETEALVLVVRRSESSEPIPVAMLSGGQKFRVALAIALGIGQFASGQTRPLESVIIDEGFGSLDKNGLRTAAEELCRLKQHLKRIILVSHQEEFTDHFPVVIRLEKGDAGVIATTIRR